MRFDVRLVLFFLLVWVNLVRLDVDYDPEFQEDGESEYRLEYAHTIFKHKKGGEGRLLRGRFTPKIEKNFTFEGWVRREKKNPTLSKQSPQGYKTLACKWNKTRSGVWDERDTNWALIIDDYGFLHFFMGNGLVSTFGLRVRHITPLEFGVWSHVAVTMEYTEAGLPSQAKVFLNGLYTPGHWKGPGKEQGVDSSLYIGNVLGDTPHDNKEWYAAFDVARYWSAAKSPEEVAITRRLTADNFYPNTAEFLAAYYTWERLNATSWKDLFEEEKKEKREDDTAKEKANELELKKKEQEEKEKKEKEEKERQEQEEKDRLEKAERERKEKAEQERKEREKELLAGKVGPRKLKWPVVPHNPLRFTNPTCTSPEKPVGCSLNPPPRHCVRRTEYCHQTNQCPSSENPFVCGRQCISDLSECPPGCAPGFYSCYDGTCSPDLLGCPPIPQCPLSRPKRCYGQCLPLGERCVTPGAPCENPNEIVCPLDGQCKSKEDCEDTPFNGCPRVECADGRCVEDESKCTFGCPEGELRCFDGTCARICDHQPPRRRHPLEIEVTLTPQLLFSGQIKLDSWTVTATGGYVNSHQAADLLDIKLPAGVFAEVVGDKQNKFIIRSIPDSFLFKLKTAAKNHLNKAFASPVFYLGLEQMKKASLNHLIEYNFIDAYLHENKTAQDYCLGSLNSQSLRFECVEDVELVSARGNIVKLKAKTNVINSYFAIIPKDFIYVADGGEDLSVIPAAAAPGESQQVETEQPKQPEQKDSQPEATKDKRAESEEQPKADEAPKTEEEPAASSSSFSSTSSDVSPLALKLELLEQKLSKYGLNIPMAFGGLLVTALVLTLLVNSICLRGGKKEETKRDKKDKDAKQKKH